MTRKNFAGDCVGLAKPKKILGRRSIGYVSRDNTKSRKLVQIPGIGPITASALIASIGDAKHFKSGRQLVAWLGLVPKQHSSGGKPLLLCISKRGDTYLRTLLIHGARTVIQRVRHKADFGESWLARLIERCRTNVAAVALVNRNARTSCKVRMYGCNLHLLAVIDWELGK